MGVYVRGMDMPENCQECECLNVEHFFCQVSGRAPKDENIVKRRPEWCQLVEMKENHFYIVIDEYLYEAVEVETDERSDKAAERSSNQCSQ